MSYTLEKGTGDIVIKGFEDGIADDPYAGISDMRNAQIISIPMEASVNFSTTSVAPPTISTGTISSVNTGTDTITYTGASGLETGMAVVFAGSLPTGLTAGTVYWVGGVSAGTFKVYSDISLSTLIDLSSSTAGGTFTTFTMTTPKYFAYNSIQSFYWMVDDAGKVWTNTNVTTSGYWVYAGNNGGTGGSFGNGLVFYAGSDGSQWIFNFRTSHIDYTRAESTLVNNTSWVYGWNPNTGATGVTGGYLKTPNNTNNSHEAIVAPDNKVYYCDSNWVGRWYQADPNVTFNPTTPTTYVFDQTPVLPFTDKANCLAPLGNTLLIGGQKNIVYPWNTFSTLPDFPILLAENNISKMVTVNTNTFIFVGNRGRIWVTNGSQAQLYKKIPDHISGTVEPYFTWGGATSNKNQLYFSASVTTNAGVAINQYGGVWAIDLDSKAIRLTNKLSYGTYAGYATALIPNFSSAPAGTGLFIGWNSGASTYGVDTTSSTPYTNGETTIDSDLIPIGTFLKPTTQGRVEFKLAVPIVSGESIKLQYRQSFADSFTDISSTTLFNYGTSTAGGGTDWNGYAGVYQKVPFQASQWIQLRAVLTSTASSPSYVRLTELRLGN